MKKMTKDDYLRNKGLLPQENLGVMYVFRSDRDGCGEIKELKNFEINTRIAAGRRGNDNKRIDIVDYKFKESPYTASIWADQVIGEDHGYDSGIGDLWVWSTFCSLDRGELEKMLETESKRITEKYAIKDEQF